MRRSKLFAAVILMGGLAATGTSAFAQDWGYRDSNRGRDLHNDYVRAGGIDNDLARDQYRLNEALRCGRYAEAAAIRRDMARDSHVLHEQYRDIRHDRRGW